jgi:hypothetical protein
MGAVVTFNYPAWKARYPEFTGIDPSLVQLYFDEATIYCRNDGGGPVSTDAIQTTLLNMLTAHICQLNAAINGQDSSQIVGRISNASQGSVSVTTEMNLPGSAAWFAQTKYGVAYWQATAPYRTMRYMPGRDRQFDPWRPFGGGSWGNM